MKLTIGRVVLFGVAGALVAAVVTAVDAAGAVAGLTVFPPGAAPYEVNNISQGTGDGFWSWPPRGSFAGSAGVAAVAAAAAAAGAAVSSTFQPVERLERLEEAARFIAASTGHHGPTVERILTGPRAGAVDLTPFQAVSLALSPSQVAATGSTAADIAANGLTAAQVKAAGLTPAQIAAATAAGLQVG